MKCFLNSQASLSLMRSKLKCGFTIQTNLVQDYFYALKNFVIIEDNSKLDGEKLAFLQDLRKQDIKFTGFVNIGKFIYYLHLILIEGSEFLMPPSLGSEKKNTSTAQIAYIYS